MAQIWPQTLDYEILYVFIVHWYIQKKNEYRLLNGEATNNIDLPEIVHHDDDDRLIDAADDNEEEVI